ncbi:MAG: methyltransferase domain-containing protein, partial [Nitrososphaerota archaeon]|nr:methyltransferase domain-containing protein [Nitrososphaerota archaeon]
VKCSEGIDETCGLLQLKHSCSPREMFGENYGYRSGLNASMIAHLREKVAGLQALQGLNSGDLVVDIGSNDGTLLGAYPANRGLELIGVDPTAESFRRFYPEDVKLIPEFFTAESIKKHIGGKRAKVVTSISMFYDLESPLSFMEDIHEILADDGIWHFEQSYMPTMLQRNSYDTICHEHLEYYRMKQIKWLADRTGFKIIDAKFNEINGGSFAITVAKKSSKHADCGNVVAAILDGEAKKGLGRLAVYRKFNRYVREHATKLTSFIRDTNSRKKTVFGLGASTKGNVILQYCGLSEEDIKFIADVNSEKFGCYTPGTGIPIISEREAIRMHPNYFLVLPWHFRPYFMNQRQKYGDSTLVFPLPELAVA